YYSMAKKTASAESPQPPAALPDWAQPLTEELNQGADGALIFFPGSTEFADSETGFFTAQANELQSAAVARPSSTAQVSNVIKALRRHLPASVPIAIRGAGHARCAGTAKAQGGVTIDTRGLKGIEIVEDSQVIKIGAGHEWLDVYAALEKHEPPLTVMGGRNTGVGVAGFLLGGGISFLSYKYGFGVDAVRAWEVVVADGTVVRADRDHPQTSDLWDALRGGSTNFGVVTAVEMAYSPHPVHLRAGTGFYLSPARRATLQALVELGSQPQSQADVPYAPIPHAIWTMTYVAGVPFKIIAILMSTTEATGYGALQGFTNTRWRVPFTGKLREMKHSAWAQECTDMTPKKGSRGTHRTITIKLDADFLNTAVDMWYESVESIKHVAGIMYNFIFVPLPVSMLKASRDTSGSSVTNSMGLRPEDGPLATVEMNFTWRKSEDDAAVDETANKFQRELAQAAEEKGLGHRFIFPNYASPNEPVMKAYGEERLAVLKAVASKWDSDGIFQDRVVGGFKLSK
ncbi:hypothetical protein HK405_009652, partial [Cladochytrium tenue]